jgi:UDP-N-acetylmuramyl tripeptide synthase
LARPDRDAWVEDASLVLADGSRHRLELAIPGQFNRTNAAMAAVAAPFMAEVPAPDAAGLASTVDGALDRMASVDQVAGRFSATVRRGRPVRLLLAKNPAGWTALFDLLDEDGPSGGPVVLSVNARVADGLDTSWLWDVPFERLADRTVVVTGDRRRDLAVRLRYAEVDCAVVADPLDAVDRAVDSGPGSPATTVDFVGNYTAFADLRRRM